jgi:hypothetical protein
MQTDIGVTSNRSPTGIRRKTFRRRGEPDLRTREGRYYSAELRRLSAVVGGRLTAAQRAAVTRAAELSLQAYAAMVDATASLDDRARMQNVARRAERDLASIARPKRGPSSELERLHAELRR